MKENRKVRNWLIFTIGIMSFLLLIGTLVSRIYFQELIKSMEREVVSKNDYTKHYALIVEDFDDSFYQEVYEGAKQVGIKNQIYVELMGKDLSVDYSKQQLLDIAIDANVDGIIVEGDDNASLREQIKKAAELGIPVVTIGKDCTQSLRKSYIGISNYELGREYGKQIKVMKEPRKKKVLILMSKISDASQYIINSSIREVMETKVDVSGSMFEIETKLIPHDTAFSAEEFIRDLFVKSKEVPDILVCLNELYTTCATQAIIDYNKVGLVTILGYFTNDTILNAIEEKVVYSTISIDTKQMGAYCVEALTEYIETGYVNEYLSVDLTVVSSQNVKEFMIHENVSQTE